MRNGELRHFRCADAMRLDKVVGLTMRSVELRREAIRDGPVERRRQVIRDQASVKSNYFNVSSSSTCGISQQLDSKHSSSSGEQERRLRGSAMLRRATLGLKKAGSTRSQLSRVQAGSRGVAASGGSSAQNTLQHTAHDGGGDGMAWCNRPKTGRPRLHRCAVTKFAECRASCSALRDIYQCEGTASPEVHIQAVEGRAG